MAKKRYVDKDVYTLALERVRHAYELFDTIVVSFSGGKDSTAALNVTLEVARELGKTPVKAIFWDEECIPYETENYVRRVYNDPDVDLKWMCIPQKTRNGCSQREPYMYLWDPEVKDKWARPMPLEAISNWPVTHLTHKHLLLSVYPPKEYGNVGLIMGIRAAESITRYRAATAKETENYIVKYGVTLRTCIKCGGKLPKEDAIIYSKSDKGTCKFVHPGKCYAALHDENVWKVYPVYDWSNEDVWTAPDIFGWDYNRAYDVMEMAGLSKNQQRCSPAFGHEALQKLYIYKTCFPRIWEKMQYRVKGARTALRYSTTSLYSYGQTPDKPDNFTWPEFLKYYLDKLPPKLKKETAKRIQSEIKMHYRKTSDPILKNAPHPETGLNWNLLLKIAIRTDMQNRKQAASQIDTNKLSYYRERYNKELEEWRAKNDKRN